MKITKYLQTNAELYHLIVTESYFFYKKLEKSFLASGDL